MRRIQGLIIAAWLAAACSADLAGQVAAPSPVPSAEEAAAPSSIRYVDGTLPAVSRSQPSKDAVRALELCGLTVSAEDLDRIAGMGFIGSARRATKYVNLTGREPEIQVDKPAWLIQLRGDLSLGRFGVATDATCLVIDGVPTVLMTGSVTRGDVTVEPLIPPTPPDLLLPPLDP